MFRIKRIFCAIAVILALSLAVSCAGSQSLDPEIAQDALLSATEPSSEYDDDVSTIIEDHLPMGEFTDDLSKVTPNPAITIEANGSLTVLVETTNGTTTTSGNSLTDEAAALIDLVNTERKNAGLPALEYDPYLEASALMRSAEITVSWSHTRPNGSSWSTVADDIGGENLGSGYPNAGRVIKGWMNSEIHKSIVLYPTFTRVGAAAFKSSNGKLFWAMHFGL